MAQCYTTNITARELVSLLVRHKHLCDSVWVLFDAKRTLERTLVFGLMAIRHH